MKFHEFIGQVQSKARLADEGAAVTATRATLESLGERIQYGQIENISSQLPQEIGNYFLSAKVTERFDLDEYYQRVSKKSHADLPDAVFQAKSVFSVLREAVSEDAFDKLCKQLPDSYNPLFEITN